VTVKGDEVQRRPAPATSEAAVAPASFEEIFDQHWGRVVGVLFRLTGERAGAEDLALEVFWRLYRDPPAPRRDSNLAGWLYRVAMNLGRNARRARARRARHESAAGREWLAAGGAGDPDAAVERESERERVRHVLGAMKPRAAELLVLRYSGLSYAELAGALGVAPGSVGTLLARAEAEFERRLRALDRG
jgi:RNA polymerase sigma-70 factor (ECF subfamily)